MKNVVCFITGTNAVGKSTVAKNLIERFGGVERVTGDYTYCNDGKTLFLGKYNYGGKFEGVDCYNSTNDLYKKIQQAQKERRIVIGEGFYLHSFGINLQKALFQGERQLVVLLYAPIEILNERLKARSGTGATEFVGKTQKASLNDALRWREVGVPVLAFDTSKVSSDEIAESIITKIKEL